MNEEMRKCSGRLVHCDGDCCSCDVPIALLSQSEPPIQSVSKTRKMDRLSRHAAEAKAAGMSYGKYMATLQQQPPAARYPLVGVDKKAECGWCGEPVPRESRRRKYCCEECARKARDKKKNDKIRSVYT